MHAPMHHIVNQPLVSYSYITTNAVHRGFCTRVLHIYPMLMCRGKVIGLSVRLSVYCRRHHENRQILTSRHQSNSKVQQIC